MSQMPLDIELLDAKPVKALRKEIGDGAIKDFVCMSDEDLKAVISSGMLECEEATREVKKNSEYADAVGIKSSFDSALRDKKKPIMKKIKAAAFVLGARKDARRS